jgi:hypothetical protein
LKRTFLAASYCADTCADTCASSPGHGQLAEQRKCSKPSKRFRIPCLRVYSDRAKKSL